MARAVLYIFVALLLISLLRSVIGVLGKAVSGYLGQDPAAKSRGPELHNAGELKRDPVCGTYVSTTTSVKQTIRGETVHFCSPECSAKYRKG
jgi:YHS domain-containing protein